MPGHPRSSCGVISRAAEFAELARVRRRATRPSTINGTARASTSPKIRITTNGRAVLLTLRLGCNATERVRVPIWSVWASLPATRPFGGDLVSHAIQRALHVALVTAGDRDL